MVKSSNDAMQVAEWHVAQIHEILTGTAAIQNEAWKLSVLSAVDEMESRLWAKLAPERAARAVLKKALHARQSEAEASARWYIAGLVESLCSLKILAPRLGEAGMRLYASSRDDTLSQLGRAHSSRGKGEALNYFAPVIDPAQKAIRQIKGNFRRAFVADAIEKDGLTSVPARWQSNDLSDVMKAVLGNQNPRDRGGEDLPDLELGEVEIARLTLVNSVHGEVSSLRARPEEDTGSIILRIVDEYETPIVLPYDRAQEPLTPQDVVRLFVEAEPSQTETTSQVEFQSFFYPNLNELPRDLDMQGQQEDELQELNLPRASSGADVRLYPIPVEEVTPAFSECWRAAGSHLNSMARDARIGWPKSDLLPPFLEHLSFRLGNQLFFVRLEDADGHLVVPGTIEGLKMVAEGCRGVPCIMPMTKSPDGWRPHLPGWGIIDATTRRSVDPAALVNDAKIEMTDWELHDFAVQVVRERLKADGYTVLSSQGNPDVDPALWFAVGNAKQWVVVRAVRFPTLVADVPHQWRDISKRCSQISPHGNFASVAVAGGETREGQDADIRLLRGYPLFARYTGLSQPSGDDIESVEEDFIARERWRSRFRPS